jgi:histidinol dehydrogenase
MLAGPTEVVIVSSKGNPAFIAADLIAQAEHDPETLAVFITTSRKLACAVENQIRADPQELLRENTIAKQSLASRGAILIAGSREQAFDWANRIAPEHLTIDKDKKDLALVRNAGSVFIGDYSAQAAGDYASGPNHVLPTGGAARFRGGLSVMDFVKVISVQELSSASLRKLSPTIVRLAETEGLRVHAESVRVRCPGA